MQELVELEVPYHYQPKVYTYQRSTGWYWKYELPDSSWFYCFASEHEAVARRNAAKKITDLARGLFTQKEVEKMQKASGKVLTFEDAVTRYTEHLALERTPTYIRPLRVDLVATARHLKEKHRITLVHEFEEAHAHKFRDELLAAVKRQEIRKVTARNKLNNLKRLFKWLRKRKLIVTSPWADVEPILVPVEDQARTVATSGDAIKQLLAADYQHPHGFPIKEFALLLYRVGPRQGEALHMEVEDVNWQTGEWRIRPKTCPTKFGMEWVPKYRKTRTVYLPKDVRDALAPLVERARNHQVVGYTPGEGKGKIKPVEANFIFTALDRSLSNGKRKVYRRVDGIRGAWGALFVAAGLAEKVPQSSSSTKKYKDGVKFRTDMRVAFTRHDTRRGFNVAMKTAGMGLEERALFLGHAKEVNQRHYVGGEEFDLKAVAEFMDGLALVKDGA